MAADPTGDRTAPEAGLQRAQGIKAAERQKAKESIGARLAPWGWVTTKKEYGQSTSTSITYPLLNWDGRLSEGESLHMTLSVSEHLSRVTIAHFSDADALVPRQATFARIEMTRSSSSSV